MSLSLTAAEPAWLRRFKERRRDGRRPDIDVFDDGWQKFSARSHALKGVDGASYVDTTHESGHQYVEISSTGYFELIQTPQDPGEWIRGRASTAAEPLVPLSAIGGDCRSDREDQVLAFVAQRPGELRELSWMPADVFTTNRRFEMYDAMLTLRVTAMKAAEKLFGDNHRAVLAHQHRQSNIVHPPTPDMAPVTTAQRALESGTQVLPLNVPTLLDTVPTLQARS